jgi:hypothetical protein
MAQNTQSGLPARSAQLCSALGSARQFEGAEFATDRILATQTLQSCLPEPMGISVPTSTNRIDTFAVNEYCEKCRAWAAEFLRLNIPLPNEVAA